MTLEEPDGEVEPQSPSGIAERLRDAHLGSLLAGISVVFVVLKVLVVSHFETTTALAIVAESGTAPLLVGALVRTIDSVILTMLVILVVAASDEGRPEADRRLYRRVGWCVALLTVLVQHPLMALLVVLLSWAAFGGPGRDNLQARILARRRRQREKKLDEDLAVISEAAAGLTADAAESEQLLEKMRADHEAMEVAVDEPDSLSKDELLAMAERGIALTMALAERQAASGAKVLAALELGTDRRSRREAANQQSRKVRRRAMRNMWALAAVCVFSMVAPVGNGLLTDRPWLPAERIVFDGRPALTGYVLRADDEESIVLADSPRRIVRATDKVVRREYCRVEGYGSRFWWSTAALLRPAPSYPLCKKLSP